MRDAHSCKAHADAGCLASIRDRLEAYPTLPRLALTNAAAIAAIVMTMNSPHPSSEEIFHRLLDESSARLAAPESRGIVIPDDELHREIIVPLLPAMLADAAIRQHWNAQAATGFVARLARHLDGGESAPRWLAGDFEIHVTASYSASPDARALADTLLSEDSLRDLTAALMNQLLDALWPSLTPVAIATPEAPLPQEFPTLETLPPHAAPLGSEPERAREIHPQRQPGFSSVLVRTLCRKLSASVVNRAFASPIAHDTRAAIIARRICQRAAATASAHRPKRSLINRRTESRTACLG